MAEEGDGPVTTRGRPRGSFSVSSETDVARMVGPTAGVPVPTPCPPGCPVSSSVPTRSGGPDREGLVTPVV